ncbi:MAG: hypothetical protein IKV67_03305 [Paludibacteraceae bacterium]|nr:hypothetical protein [Paludibacteraceae bacterium]
MKKILIFLIFSVFFCSCPMEDVTWDEGLDIRIQNKTQRILCVDFKYDVDKRIDYTAKKDSIMTDSTEHLCGIGFDEHIKDKAFPILKERIHNKNLLVKNVEGDTLAVWTDSSLVFCDNQYWIIVPDEKNNEVHCTLQLTDEVLKLK